MKFKKKYIIINFKSRYIFLNVSPIDPHPKNLTILKKPTLPLTTKLSQDSHES